MVKIYVVNKMYHSSILEHLKKPLFSSKMATIKILITIHIHKSQAMFVSDQSAESQSVHYYNLNESTTYVESHCSCPAELSACCNHITATLYCLEEYI